MPIIQLGRGGGADTTALTQGLALGRQAALREKEYQTELALIQRQIQQQDAEREFSELYGGELAKQGQLKKAKGQAPAMAAAGQALGGVQGALLKLQADGVGQAQEQQVTLQYLLAQNPEAVQMYARMRPEVRSRFEADILRQAQSQMDAELTEKALGDLTKLEAQGIVPPGTVAQRSQMAAAGYENGGSLTEYAGKAVKAHGDRVAKTQMNQEKLVGLDEQIAAALPAMDEDTQLEVRSLRAQLDVGMQDEEPTLNPAVHRDLVGKLAMAQMQMADSQMGAIQGALPGPGRAGAPADALRAMFEQATAGPQLGAPMPPASGGAQPSYTEPRLSTSGGQTSIPSPAPRADQGPATATPPPVQAQQAQPTPPRPRAELRRLSNSLRERFRIGKDRQGESRTEASEEALAAWAAENGLSFEDMRMIVTMAVEAAEAEPPLSGAQKAMKLRGVKLPKRADY